jgi:hypothetical protein
LACGMVEAWRRISARNMIRLALVLSTTLWLIMFAIPFDVTAFSEPDKLPLAQIVNSLYLRGPAAGDAVIADVSAMLDSADPAPSHIYADWRICHLLYFYGTRPVECLSKDDIGPQMTAVAENVLKPGDEAYLIVNGYAAGLESIMQFCKRDFSQYNRPDYFPIFVWHIQKEPCSP